MKAPVSWIRELVELPDGVTTEQLTARLTALGLKLEAIQSPGAQISGPLVVGRVLTREPEPQKNGKTINWCFLDVGPRLGPEFANPGDPGVGIVCGAHNFDVGDLVVVILPGGVLPGNFAIGARKTYGHLSAGMICSASELGISVEPGQSAGIIVLPAGSAEPGTDARAALGLDDEVIEFEINPDRAYALSLRGIAREAALGFDVPFDDPASTRSAGAGDDGGYPAEVEDPVGCPVFTTRVVTGFDPTAPTPDFMARRLTQAGMRPISLAVDVTNYVMLELGQPLHAYDRARLQGPIVVRRARPGERLTTLDDADRALDPDDLLITDDSGPIGLAGVMGGASTEISEASHDLVIEAAHFDPVTVFRSGRRHRLTSEAGKRNERGVDPRLPLVASLRAAELMAQYGGGRIEDGSRRVGAAPEQPVITLAADLPARISGLAIDTDTAVAHLEAVGCAVERDGATEPQRLRVTTPSWRPDLNDPYDLVEEVARIVGYESVPSVLPTPPAGRGLTREQRLRRRVGRTLAGAGLTEVISFPFVGPADLDRLGLPTDDVRRRTVRLANPLSAERPDYTTTLLPGLLETAARNLSRGAPGVALFETATVAFPADVAAPVYGVDRRPDDAELAALLAAVPRQPLTLGLVLAGERERPGWWGEGRAAGWADALAAVRRLAGELGVPVSTSGVERAPWHPGRCAAVRIASAGDEPAAVIGHAGELHPAVCADYGLPPRSAAVELDLDALLAAAVDVVPGPVLSSFPLAKEDVALVVDDAVTTADVEAALREGAGPLLESIRLFDVYAGQQIGAGSRSLAFALRFRAADRTLTEDETGAARDAAVAVAVERCGAVQR